MFAQVPSNAKFPRNYKAFVFIFIIYITGQTHKHISV